MVSRERCASTRRCGLFAAGRGRLRARYGLVTGQSAPRDRRNGSRARLALALRAGIARTPRCPLRAIADGRRHQGPCWLLAVLLARRRPLRGRPWATSWAVRLTLDSSPDDGSAGILVGFIGMPSATRPPVRHGPHGAALRPPGVARAPVRRAGWGPDGSRETGPGREPHIAGCVPATPPGLLTVTREAITEPSARRLGGR